MKFDGYTFQARIIPSIVFLIPIIVELNYVFAKLNYNITITLPIINIATLCFVMIFANWVRYLGRKREKELFKLWGGAPTTRFLRYNNEEFNPQLKAQVKHYLKVMFNKIKFPKEDFETQNPEQADKVYEVYVANIRSLTRDNKKFKLIWVENKNYGMWRNLYGIKKLALVEIGFLIIANMFLAIFCESLFFANEVIAIDLFYFADLIMWVFIVTEKRVKDVANCYTERLFEAVIMLNDGRGIQNERKNKRAD